jgi:hypothetical protein
MSYLLKSSYRTRTKLFTPIRGPIVFHWTNTVSLVENPFNKDCGSFRAEVCLKSRVGLGYVCS